MALSSLLNFPHFDPILPPFSGEAAACLVLGPFIGSFCGVLMARVPQGQGFAAGRSRCGACGHAVGPLELVPILSFAALRGKCRHCGAAIPARDLLVELAALFIAALACLTPDPAFIPWGAGLGWALLALAGIDFAALRLPDFLTLPLLMAGLGEALWLEPETLTDRAVAAALAYLSLRAIGETYYFLRKRQGLGQGDAKLFAAGGAWLGSAALPFVLLIASFAALMFAGARALRAGKIERSRLIPLGPFLALGIFSLWLWRSVT